MRRLLFELGRRVYARVGGPGLGLQPFFQRWLQPGRVQLDGFHLYLDPEDRMISFTLAMKGEWAPFETQIFKRFVRPGAVVLDVGAHIGYFTLLASTLAGPSGRVYAFEPEPKNRALLDKNVASNGRTNVVVVPSGVADKPGRLRLRLHAENKGKHSLYPEEGEDAGSVEIEAVALGPWLRERGVRPSFIKIDVEGGEWRALDGMRELLEEERPPALLLEYFPQALRRSGREPREWLDRLAALGFSLKHVDEARRELRPLNPKQVEETFPASSCDLLCEKA